MPYDEYLAERIRNYFTEQKVPFYVKNMMGGCVFMVNDKMCCGIHFDKKKKIDLLMARIGENAAIEFADKKVVTLCILRVGQWRAMSLSIPTDLI